MNNFKWHLLFVPAVEYINILKPSTTLQNKTNEIHALTETGNKTSEPQHYAHILVLVLDINYRALFINLFSIFKEKMTFRCCYKNEDYLCHPFRMQIRKLRLTDNDPPAQIICWQ